MGWDVWLGCMLCYEYLCPGYILEVSCPKL